MAKQKITKEQIVKGATFELKMGIVTIVDVEISGYKKGVDLVRTSLNGKNFANSTSEIKSFINQNLK